MCRLMLIFIATCLLLACTPATAATEQQGTTPGAFYKSYGGGEPRTPAYWLTWNTCAENNQSELAKTNGGREAGWILMDDLLTQPGIRVGNLQVQTCQEGINILQGYDLQGNNLTNDTAYLLASQLFAAQLNLAAGSESCLAVNTAANQAQALLEALQFDGKKSILSPPRTSPDIDTARSLAKQLEAYNTGALCIP